MIVIYFYLEISLSTDLSVLSPNAGKYGPEITPYLDTFHAVNVTNIHKEISQLNDTSNHH